MDNERPSTDKSITVIGETVNVEGTINSEDHIRVEGKLQGSITTTNDVTVGKNAQITADITAQNMTIAGEVKGKLNASGTLTLRATARVYGDITTNIISIETGAVMQGQCISGSGSNTTSSVPTADNKNKSEKS